MRGRLFLLTLLLVLIAVAVLAFAGSVAAEAGPMVERPSGNGPMSVGFFDTVIRCSQKSYDTQLRIYYPATDWGINAPPDPSGAPYMTVVWFPFFGGDQMAVEPQSEKLCSWGAVVVAYGVNWQDMEGSGNPSDMNDLLDMLEDMNSTVGSRLFGMVDKEAYGVCGYSSGGGISLITGAQVTRIKAIQSWAAAIYNAAVDGIAPMFNGRPLLLQVGKDDDMYIEGSERAYKKVGAPCILVEPLNAGHGGPFLEDMYVAFFLYHLQGDDEYFTFLYGDGAVEVTAQGIADVYFKLGGDHFFPPKVTTKVSPSNVPMDGPVSLEATIRGYQMENETMLVHGWDVYGDGRVDLRVNDGPNTTFAYSFPGRHEVQYHYMLDRFVILGTVHTVDVVNLAPVAVAGSDIMVDHDGSAMLDGGASWDSPSDTGKLRYRWDFSDGYATNSSYLPTVTRQFTNVGVLTATLTVLDPHGGMATDKLNVTVSNLPPRVTIDREYTVSEDENLTLEGVGNDTLSHVGDLLYRWDFGDGMGRGWTGSSLANHSYARSGNYTVTLSVRDPEGDENSTTTTVTVLNADPVGTIVRPLHGSSHDKEVPVDFEATGADTPSDEVDLLFMWNFGDGTSTDWLGRRDTRVSRTYSAAGEYTVELTVRDSDGGVHMVASTITVVNTPPQASIVRPWPSVTVNEDARVAFKGAGSDTPGDETGLSFQWTIDGTVYGTDSTDHVFTSSGEYACEFLVTDPDGATDSMIVTVTVENVVPEATLEVDATTLETGDTMVYRVHLFDTPSDLERLSISWDFGDGTVSTDVNGSHVFTEAGSYLVKVTVEDDDGATAVASVGVTVTEPPDGPPDPNGGGGPGVSGGDGVDLVTIVGIVVALAIAVLLVLFHLMRKGPTSGTDGDEEYDGH